MIQGESMHDVRGTNLPHARRPVETLLSLTTPVAIAHRGGSGLRPENTLAAFDNAVSLGVDALECDVHLSRDGEVVIIHDATLERTTDATGPVEGRTADELYRIDAGFRFGPDRGLPFRDQGIGVPRLSTLLRRHPRTPVIVEIKGESPATAGRVIDTVRECGAEDRVIFAGFSQAVLSAVRQRSATYVTNASRPEVLSAMRRSYLWLPPRPSGCRVFQLPLALQGRRVLTRHLARVLRRGGMPIHAWIIDDEAQMRMLIEWGVTGLISDRPDRAVPLVAACRQRGADA